MEQTYIDWNVPNWVSVVLMAAVGYMLIGFFQKLIAKKQGK